ncbi:hypothetical protein GGH94_005161 [Coemansia aciculifera]|uniref:Uncharacterized protein n=1 Tax=Coemansia aciculifera TaxID=417176 RepID=A0A9W8IJ01_9FUNG|nr:hypothetical protein GGH94_005161 [Coemansia aciculifera]
MRSLQRDSDTSRCSPLELLDLKTLLHKAGCLPGRLQPSKRAHAIPPLPPSATLPQHPSILRRPDAQQSAGSQRHVKFVLPSTPSDISCARSLNSTGGNSDKTASHDFDTEAYINERCRQAARESEAMSAAYVAAQMVQRIPEPCLRELVDLGSLDRTLVVYTRELGRLAIDNYRPFKSLYFYGVVLFHLGKHRPIDFHDAARVCDAAVTLNNASSPITPFTGNSIDVPSLYSFLGLGVDLSGNLAMSVTDGVARARTSWNAINLARMAYALPAGRLVANLEEPAVLNCLAHHINRRCVIRPVFNYMFEQFTDSGRTELPVVDEALQFQIYSTVREVMTKVYGTSQPLPLSYVMYTTLFAIIETNEKVVRGIAEAGGTPSDICTTVFSGSSGDRDSIDNTDSSTNLSDPMRGKEMLELLDWDLAAAIGYLLAHRYHESDVEVTKMRAKLGALAFGVDASVSQPFPPILPLQDTGLHQYVHHYVSAIYCRWPHGFAYMVIDETVDAYNVIIQTLREELGLSSS